MAAVKKKSKPKLKKTEILVDNLSFDWNENKL